MTDRRDRAAPRELAGWYRLAAETIAAEPDEALLAVLAEVPELAAHATPQAAARHTHVFVLNVYPFASVYLGDDGALHGERAAFTRDVFRALGLRTEERDGVAADHLAVALDALAALLEREADADEAVDAAVDAARARHAQRTVLGEHLLPWLPHVLGAVERVDDGLYAAVAGRLRETLRRHAARLATFEDAVAPTPTPAAPEPEAPTPDDPLAWLAAPARCGMFLARDDLAVLAAEAGLPARIGGRRFVLRELGRAAVSDAEAAALGDALAAFARARRCEALAWQRELPTFASVWRPLLDRLDATEARLWTAAPSAAAGA
jgi:TorA maturation chaperone TorD